MPLPVNSKYRRMRQLLLILWSLLISGTLTAQEQEYYYVKNNGNISPEISYNQSSEEITINLDIESFSARNINYQGKTASKITLPGGISLMERGLPDIQHLATSVAIAPTGKINVIVTNSEYTDYPSFNIAPSSGDPGIYPSGALVADTSIYNANAFWPATLVQTGDPYIMENTRGLSMHFYPVQYNPVTHVLRVYHQITISLVNTGEPGINEITRLSPYASSSLSNLIDNHFINGTSIEASSRYTTVNEAQGKMLIIAHPSFIEAMQPFVNWKIQKGIDCQLIDVTTIGNENKIKEYVSDYYFNNGLTYLLLVGDAELVPSNQAEKGLSDITYGFISGDDHYPEILVGRFPCQTAEQCRIMVERTITYEKNPSVNADYNNFLGIGSEQGPGDDWEFDYEHIRNIGAQLNTSVYPDLTELYDGSKGGSDMNGNPTSNMAVEAINKGQGAIMYIGHGSINSWLTTGFNTTNALKLENTETFPFIWAAGCNNGVFNNATCLAEGFLRASSNGKPTGAIATLMSAASQTWYPPMEAQDEIALLLSNHQNNKAITFGGISFSGCMKMNDKYGKGAYIVTDNWILFGDPSVELRTAVPREFNPEYDSITGSDISFYSVTGIPDEVTVTAICNNKIIASAQALEGRVDLNINNLNSVKSFTLTITGKNFKPFIAEVKVTNMPSIAMNPVPADHSLKVSTSTPFAWTLGTGCIPDSFSWSIRKKGAAQWETINIENPDQLTHQKLEYLTTYEWKVVSINANGGAESKIFDFTTTEAPDEDFEQGNFPRSNWLNTESWYIDNLESYEGNFSLHSGSTVTRESSSLYYECETLSCDFISFWLKQNISDQYSGIQFFMDDFLVAEWDYTINWTNFIYQIEAGHHKFEWRFSGSGDSSSVNSAAWIDNIYLPENAPLIVSALSRDACPENFILLDPVVSNHASIKWETNGNGYFDDVYRVDAIYFPAQDELLSGVITLNLTVYANNICDAENYEYIININQLPQFNIPDDTTLFLNETLTVPTANNSANQYLIYSDQSISSSLEIDPGKLVPGENLITIVAENSNGCPTEKRLNINLISTERPSERSLSIYPNPASDIINLVDGTGANLSKVNIYSTDGQLIGQYDFNGIGNTSLPVGHLNPGIYIITSENSGSIITSKFIKI